MSILESDTRLIEFRNVSKRFGQQLPISNVNFFINKGNLTTVIGPNGAGKTTIARLILGLEVPSSGEIIIRPNLKIGYAPQNLDFALELPMNVENFLQLLTQNSANSSWEEIVNFIDFDNLKHHDISKLSGGQLQKLILTASLLNNPDLIILDEPTQSLDITSQQEFYRIINQIKKRQEVTIVMISHDLLTVMKNADQVICLNGHICCSGKPSDLTTNQDFLDSLSTIGIYIHHHDHKH